MGSQRGLLACAVLLLGLLPGKQAGAFCQRRAVRMGARGGGLVRRDESRRQSRISQYVKSELSAILLTGHGVKSPRGISDELRRAVSVVDVDVSPDLRNCNVYVSVRGDALAKREAYSWLVRSTRALRHRLAERNRSMKRVPEILFKEADVSAAVDVMRLIEEANAISGGAQDEEDEHDDYLGFDGDEEDLEMFMEEDEVEVEVEVEAEAEAEAEMRASKAEEEEEEEEEKGGGKWR